MTDTVTIPKGTLDAVTNAGGQMSNICFNLSQSGSVGERDRASIRGAHQRWDSSVADLRSALSHHNPPPETHVEDNERYRVARAIVASGVGELSFDQWSEDMQTVFIRQADAAIATIAATPVANVVPSIERLADLIDDAAPGILRPDTRLGIASRIRAALSSEGPAE